MGDGHESYPLQDTATGEPRTRSLSLASSSSQSSGMILIPHAILKQVIVACCASLGYLTIGLVRGFSSPAIPSMTAVSPELVPDHSAISWISAIPPFGAFLGSLASGPIMGALGRKGTLLVGAPLFVIAWLAIAFSPTPALLVLARASSGFCVGIVLPSAQVYVSECSHPRIRGRLGSLPALFMAAGILVAYIVGSFVSWFILALVSAAFPLVLMVLLIPLPESPAWLRNKKRHEEADRALEWLHLQPKTAQVELYTVEQAPKAVAEPEAQEKSIRRAKSLLRGPYSPSELCRRAVLIPFALVIAILIFQQFSGIDTIIFYTVSIFKASGSTMDEYQSTIVVGVVQLVATVVSFFIIDKFGRKPLLLSSGVIMFLSMAVLGWYFYLHDRGRAEGLGLVPLISQMVFIAGFSIGYSNVPFLLMGELLPSAQRSLLSSVAGAMNLGSMFLVIKTYPDTVTLIGSAGAFWLYSLFCLLSCFFVGFLLPETKGKSLEEIEAIFERKQKKHEEQKSES